MSAPGWYPDPAGAADQFRYWDGDNWSEQTTSNPTQVPPAPASPPQRHASKNTWLIAIVALAVLTVVIVVWALRGASTGTRDPLPSDTNTAAPTISAWDETSTPTPPPTTADGAQVVCPTTTHNERTTQRSGTLSADTLVVDQIPGWPAHSMYFQFAYDTHSQADTVVEGSSSIWMSNISVALMHHDDGFTDIRTSAEQALDCIASSGYYLEFTHRVAVSSEQISISGRPAWHIVTEVRVADPEFPGVEGDVVDIIVVDLGMGKDYLGLYYSCYTIGDTERGALVDAATASLRVTE